MPPRPPPASAQNPPTPPPEARGGRSLFAKLCGWIHGCAQCLWTLAVLIACPALYLWIAGLPGSLANRLLSRIDSDPYAITAERIGITPRARLLLHSVLIYPTNSYAEPLVRVDQLAIRPRLRALLHGRVEPLHVSIDSGLVLMPAGNRAMPNRADHRVVLTNIQASLTWDPNSVVIESLQAHCYALGIDITGSIGRTTSDLGEQHPWRELAHTVDEIRNNQRLIPALVNALAEMRSDDPPRLSLAISGVATALQADARLESGPFVLNTQRIDRIRAHATWKPNRIHLEYLRVEGPDHLRMEVRAEPSAPGAIPDGLTGFFAFDRFFMRGIEFTRGEGRIASSDGILLLEKCRAEIGPDGTRGEAAVNLAWDPARGIVEGQLDLRLDPNDFAPVLTSNQLRIARRFGFSNELPRFAGFFRYTDAPTNLFVEGTISARRFTYRGVPVDDMEAGLLHTNHLVRLDPWRFSRPEGVTTGRLDVPLNNRAIRVALDSSMHPAAVAAMVSPRLHQAVAKWRFDGPVSMRARGIVDASGHEEITDLVLDVEGQSLGRGRWLADQASFTLHALRGVYITTNAVGRAYGGDWRATVRVEPATVGPEHRFIVKAALTNASFAKIAEASVTPGEKTPAGRLHLVAQITGLVSDAFSPATRGGGALVIEDGAILKTPLFGGLSDLLSRLVPGLGFVSQTDLTCSYRIEEGAIYSNDIRLSGDLISMRADGEMEFDGAIRMRVEVQLLRRGPLAALLRLLTMPVTKLFEFRLTGTLEDPKWRPVNLPKELFLIFD